MGLMPRKDQGQARHPARPLPAAGGLHPRQVPPAPPAAIEDRRDLDAARATDRRAEPARGEDGGYMGKTGGHGSGAGGA